MRASAGCSSGTSSTSPSSTRVSTTEVALSGVTATERTCSSGFRVISWIESTAPSVDTHRRGSSRSRSAFRAYSIELIGATSSSPPISIRLSVVGTPEICSRPAPSSS